jgi:mRNA interferase RelE/StbE
MIYELAFLDEALKEWRKLDPATRDQFKTKLTERLQNPKIPAARLHGAKERYKIKLRNAGYRLVYEVRDREVLVLVVAVGKRERNEVWGRGSQRHSTSTVKAVARAAI